MGKKRMCEGVYGAEQANCILGTDSSSVEYQWDIEPISNSQFLQLSKVLVTLADMSAPRDGFFKINV